MKTKPNNPKLETILDLTEYRQKEMAPEEIGMIQISNGLVENHERVTLIESIENCGDLLSRGIKLASKITKESTKFMSKTLGETIGRYIASQKTKTEQSLENNQAYLEQLSRVQTKPSLDNYFERDLHSISEKYQNKVRNSIKRLQIKSSIIEKLYDFRDFMIDVSDALDSKIYFAREKMKLLKEEMQIPKDKFKGQYQTPGEKSADAATDYTEAMTRLKRSKKLKRNPLNILDLHRGFKPNPKYSIFAKAWANN